MSPVGVQGGPKAFRVVLLAAGLGVWWGALVAVVWYRPNARALPSAAKRRLQFSMTRRILSVALCLPAWALLSQGGTVVAGIIALSLAAFVWQSSGVRYDLDQDGIERSGGVHRRLRFTWHEVRLVQVFPKGVVLYGEDGKSMLVNNMMLDGYPEFAAALLRHLPAGTRGMEQGRAILEAQAAWAIPT